MTGSITFNLGGKNPKFIKPIRIITIVAILSFLFVYTSSFCLLGQDLKSFHLSEKASRTSTLKLSTIADKISYTPLETNAQCLIDRVSGIVELPDNYLITTGNAQVFLFRKDGSYVRTIGQRGQGPMEYPSLGGAFWNENRKEIILYNNTHYKLFFYSLDGRFLREIRIPYKPTAMYQLHDGTFLCELSYDQKIDAVYSKCILFDVSGKVTPFRSQRWDPKTGEPMIVIPSGFLNWDNQDLFHPAYNDTIFTIKNGQQSPFMCFGLSKLLFPVEAAFNPALYEQVNGNTILRIHLSRLNPESLLLGYTYRGKNVQAICNVQSGNAEVFQPQKPGFVNDLDGGAAVISLKSYNPTSKMIHISCQAVDLKEIAQNSGNTIGPAFKKLTDNLSVDDNPVIMHLHVKDRITLDL